VPTWDMHIEDDSLKGTNVTTNETNIRENNQEDKFDKKFGKVSVT
jgi:hypothetical protein